MPGTTIKGIQPSFCPEDAINFLSNLTKLELLNVVHQIIKVRVLKD